MRRGFSIFLIAFFAFGPLSVLLDSEEASLPPCCRRNGAHHCVMATRMAAMMRDAASGKTPTVEAPTTCPRYPGLTAFFTTPAPGLTASAVNLAIPRTQIRASFADYAAPRSAPAHAYAGRGPPLADL